MTVNNIKMASGTLEGQKEEGLRNVESTKREEKALRKDIADIRKTIDVNLYDFLKQEQIEKVEAEKLHQHLVHNQKLEGELEALMIICTDKEKTLERLKADSDLKVKKLFTITPPFLLLLLIKCQNNLGKTCYPYQGKIVRRKRRLKREKYCDFRF